jgi:hypothetical protein
LFFEKKKQKTFDCWRAPRRQRAQRDKSFLVLFFKKEHPFSLVRQYLPPGIICRALATALTSVFNPLGVVFPLQRGRGVPPREM